MHHITPFWDEKFINFLGRGTTAPQTPPPSPLIYGASILASSALNLRPPPQCSSGVDAHDAASGSRESFCYLKVIFLQHFNTAVYRIGPIMNWSEEVHCIHWDSQDWARKWLLVCSSPFTRWRLCLEAAFAKADAWYHHFNISAFSRLRSLISLQSASSSIKRRHHTHGYLTVKS